MSKNIFVLAFIFSVQLLFAQQGNYFLSHFTPADERIDYVTYAMAQDQKGIIYFANKSGVIEFDGRNWTLIPTSGPVYSIAVFGQEVYISGFNGFGKLVLNSNNNKSYQSLSDGVAGATQIFSSLAKEDKVYFLSEKSLLVFTKATSKTEVIKAQENQGAFTGIYEIGNQIHVATEHKGLSRIEGNKISETTIALPDNQYIVFVSSLVNKALIGGNAGRLFIYDGVLKEIPVGDKSFLEHNVIVSGTWVSESLIAVGTLRGGVIFINAETGVTEEITNFYTGLPDNEVFSLFCDRNQGLWVAHDYGFTRVAPFLPFRSYSHYDGLAGNLLCAITHKGQIYVGTTLGLYALTREEVYEEQEEQTDQESKEGKSALSFLKKKRQTNTPTVNPGKGKAKNRQPVIKTIRYVFKKVSGIDSKTSQLIEADGRLIAAGISGMMEVEGLTSKFITRDPVRSVFVSPALKQLVASTLREEVKTFVAEAGKWKDTQLLDTLNDYVSYIFEDKFQNLWLCSRTKVYKVETIDNLISNVEAIPFTNASIDETTGLAYGNDVYVAASGTINRYDAGKNKFEKYDSIPGPKKYFASAGYFWFYDGHKWRTVDPQMQAALKLEWLGLFNNIRFISPADKEGLWVITGGNELYKFSSNKVATERASYPLFLREVRGEQNKLAPSHTVKVSQLESVVTFEFIQPDYLSMKAVEYRYLVRGLKKDWSSWSTTNNVVNFSYLPTGTYKLEIQTRDLMGKVSDVEKIDLEVDPPYWKESWFYASEFIFFSVLVFVSMRLSGSNSRYRFISRVLSLLTVIMLIQFIQTVVSSQISFKSTPVIEFFIQVSIALLVLPIEGYLRKTIVQRSAVGTNATVTDLEKPKL